MTNLRNFLRTNSTDLLKEKLGINAKRSERYPNLVLFKYDQIESPNSGPIVNECRGIILDESKDWSIVARPFDRFFNYGDGHCANVDWSSCRVQEKLDGSMMTVYFYNGEWNVASSGNPDAAGEVNGFGFSFRDLFWKTWDAEKFPLDMLDEGATYIFELTSPYNRVVVPHTESHLRLIGVRYLETDKCSGGEDFCNDYREFNPVREFKLTSFDDIIKSFDVLDGLRQEGYVVVDGGYNRVKVKHPQYVALHHLKDSMGGGNKSLTRIIVANEGSEFLTYFPEFKPMYDDVKAKFDAWIDGLDEEYDIIFDAANGNRGKVNRKEFAAQATKTRLPSYFFSRLDGKVNTVREHIRDLPIDNVMKALKLKE